MMISEVNKRVNDLCDDAKAVNYTFWCQRAWPTEAGADVKQLDGAIEGAMLLLNYLVTKRKDMTIHG